MCSKPKVPKQKPPKPVQYLRNPFLDGAALGAEGAGRDGLRIDLGDTADRGYVDPLATVNTGRSRRGPRGALQGLMQSLAGNLRLGRR